MFLKAKGIVLRETEYKDFDKILTVLTAENGLVTAKARGVKRKTSPIRGGCQLLAYSEFTVFESKGMKTVDEAEPVELFPALRDDLELLSLASYFAQLAELLAQEDVPNPELLPLLLHALHALCVGKDQTLVKAAVEFRLAALAGFAPDLDGCAVCGNEFPDRFSVSGGALQCHTCRVQPDPGFLLPISRGTLEALRFLQDAPCAKLFSFTLGQSSLAELSGLAETYLLTRLERGFYTLDFYKSLKLT